MSNDTLLARWRAKEQRKREARLAHARARVDNHREQHPLPQLQLELNEPYVSKRELDVAYMRQLQLEQAARREKRISAAHEAAANPATPPRFPRWLELELAAEEA